MNAVAAREMSAFLDSWLAYRARHASIPGFGVAIVAGDELVFNGAYGLADVASGVPLTTDHLFGISSQSKMFTATALLQLVEQDRVQLDHVVVRYLPWLAEHADPRFHGITSASC
jgi:D-alanyl-D-alanine carboxypeptidase